MTIVRAVDGNNDWTFGKGKADYKIELYAVAQNISSRLKSFLGDCFFQENAGIDWFNLLGTKKIFQTRLAISATILNTEDVSGMIELSVSLSDERNLTIQYSVTTSYGELSNQTVEV